MNTKIVKLDINRNLYDTLTAKQGDTQSRFLLFQLLDGAIPFSLENRSVKVFATKPDGKEVFNDLIINDRVKGYCTLELTNQMLAVPGLLKLELMVIEGDKKLTTNVFYMDVKKSINSENAIVSTNEFSALLNGLASLNEYDNYKNEIAAARDGEVNLLTKVKKIDEHLDNKANINDLVRTVNVKTFGAKGDGVTDDSVFINKAIEFAKNNKIMNVYVPKGQYLIDSESIKVHTGITFYGEGSDDPYNYGGTRLYGGENLNAPLVTNDGALYHFKWFDMQVRNGKSHGAYLIDLGENTYIDRVAFYDNRGDGLRIGNNGNLTPCHLGHISTHKNDGAGLRFENINSTQVQILYLSMDDNLECGMCIDIADTSSNFQLLSWKSERWKNDQLDYQERQKTIFKLNNLNGGIVNLGQGRVHLGNGMNDSDGSVIHQTFTPGNSVGYVMWDCITKSPNATSTSYAYGYKDDKNNEAILFDDILRKSMISNYKLQIAQTRGTLIEVGRSDTKFMFGKVTSLPTYDTPYGTIVVIGNKIYLNTSNNTKFDRIINNNYDEDFIMKMGKGVVLTSPNYTKYRLKVDNTGNLTTELVE